MKKRIFFKITVAAVAILFTCGSAFVHGNAWASGGQTAVGHLNSDGTTTLLVSAATLESAFATDCNMDSTPGFHGAAFTSIFFTFDTANGVYIINGGGSNSSYPIIHHGFPLTLNGSTNDFTVAIADQNSTCTGCMCTSDGVGGCTSCGTEETGSCSPSKPANARQSGYIGTFY